MNQKLARIVFGLSVTWAGPALLTASIVNIDATIAGASVPVGGGIWNHPTGGVALSLNAGTYTFQVTNPRVNLGAIYTGWSFQTLPKYYTGYLVFDAANLNAPILDGSPSPNWFGSAQEAYDWSVANGHNVATYTLTQTTTLLFAVPDPWTSDNLGGVSLSVLPFLKAAASDNAPEPQTFLLLGAGAAMVWYWAACRRLLLPVKNL